MKLSPGFLRIFRAVALVFVVSMILLLCTATIIGVERCPHPYKWPAAGTISVLFFAWYTYALYMFRRLK